LILELLLNNQTYKLEIRERQSTPGSALVVRVGDKDYVVDYRSLDPSFYSLIIDGRSYQAIVSQISGSSRESSVFEVNLEGKSYRIQVLDEATRRLRGSRRGLAALGQQVIVAPMPGKVLKLLVRTGDAVEPGQGIVVVEAMKMENELRASAPGTVKEIKVSEGLAVNAGDPLVVLESPGQ